MLREQQRQEQTSKMNNIQKQEVESDRNLNRKKFSPTKPSGKKQKVHPGATGKILVENEELVTRADKTFVRRRKMWVRPEVADRIKQRRNATDWVRALGNYVPMYFVGDFIRDKYMNKVSQNVTVIATATPGAIKQMLNRLHIPYKPSDTTPNAFTFVMDDVTIDITPSDADTLVQELADKYFTVDAIAQSVTGAFYDHFNGLEDLKNGVLRSPYNSSSRIFTEHPIAMLHAAKYVGEYGLSPHKSVTSAIAQTKEKLGTVSKKKVGQIFHQILTTTKPWVALEFLHDQDLLKYIDPSLDKLGDTKLKQKKHDDKDCWKHTLSTLKYAKSQDLILNLSILFHDIAMPDCSVDDGKDFPEHAEKGADMTAKILSRLQMETDVVERVSNLVRYHEVLHQDHVDKTSDDFRKLKLILGDDLSRLAQLGKADCASYKDKDTTKADHNEEKIQKAVLPQDNDTLCPLNLDEIMNATTLSEGPMTNEIKDYLHNKVLYGGLSYADKNMAGELARGYVQNLAKSLDEIMVLLEMVD